MKNVIKKAICFVSTLAVVGTAYASSQQCDTTTSTDQYWYGWATCFVFIGAEPYDVSEYIEYSTTPNVQLTYAKQSCWASLFATSTEVVEVEDCAPIADFKVSETRWDYFTHAVFSSTSTDDGQIASYAWYIDGQYRGNTASINFVTNSAQVVEVKLIVTDNSGKTDEVVRNESISGPLGPNCPPPQIFCVPEPL